MGQRLALLISLLSVASCARKQTLPTTLDNHERPVANVKVVDNNVLGDEEIEEGLVNKEPTGFWFFKNRHGFEPGELARDAERIEGVYRQHGYYGASVRDVETEVDSDGHMEIAFRVDEGKPVILQDVKVDWFRNELGDYEESTKELRKEIRDEILIGECCRNNTRKGDVLDHPDYLEAKSRLHQFFIRRGYAHARIDGTVKVDRQNRTGTVKFVIDPGPRVRFGKTTIVGTSLVPISVVRSRLEWKKGDVFTPEAIETTRGRLLRLGRFSSVDITMDHQGRSEIGDVRVEVRERRLRELRLGGGAGADPVQWELRTRAEYTKTNVFFDPRSSFRIKVQPAFRWLRATNEPAGLGGEARVTLERIDFVYPLVVGQSEVAYELERFESYSVQGPKARLSLRRPFWSDQINVGVAWNGAYGDFPRLDEGLRMPEIAEALGIEDDYRLAYFDQNLAVDTRDEIIDAREGVYAGLRLEEGTGLAGGRYNYVSGEADLRTYQAIRPRAILALRGRYSRLLSGDVLPITRRYFAGGASSHRGFSQRRLSAVGGEGMSPSDFGLVGGTRRFEGSVEMRFDVYPFLNRWIKVVTFLDAGEVAEGGGEIDFTNLHLATGLGMRVGTPIGPLRADLGYRLNRYGEGEPAPYDRFAFHVSLGEAF